MDSRVATARRTCPAASHVDHRIPPLTDDAVIRVGPVPIGAHEPGLRRHLARITPRETGDLIALTDRDCRDRPAEPGSATKEKKSHDGKLNACSDRMRILAAGVADNDVSEPPTRSARPAAFPPRIRDRETSPRWQVRGRPQAY